MPLKRELKVGDIAIVRLPVVDVGDRDFVVETARYGRAMLSLSSVIDIEDPPLKPGDTVWYDGAPSIGGTLLYLHQGEDDGRK